MKYTFIKICWVIAALFGGVAAASDLPDCPTDYYVRWNDCFGTYEWSSGTKYVGEFKDGDKTGQGTLTWANGDRYVGEWKFTENGKRNDIFGPTLDDWAIDLFGQDLSKLTADNYVFEFKGAENGQGTFTWVDGSKYVGEFKDGTHTGQGTKTYLDGTVKKGIWKDGEFLGTVAEWERAEKKHKKIFHACIVDKSASVDMQVGSVENAVLETCNAIANEPSWFDSLKYN